MVFPTSVVAPGCLTDGRLVGEWAVSPSLSYKDWETQHTVSSRAQRVPRTTFWCNAPFESHPGPRETCMKDQHGLCRKMESSHSDCPSFLLAGWHVKASAQHFARKILYYVAEIRVQPSTSWFTALPHICVVFAFIVDINNIKFAIIISWVGMHRHSIGHAPGAGVNTVRDIPPESWTSHIHSPDSESWTRGATQMFWILGAHSWVKSDSRISGCVKCFHSSEISQG